MDVRIALTRPTVKAMRERLQGAYARGDVRLVRRISALLEHFVEQTPLPELSERWVGWGIPTNNLVAIAQKLARRHRAKICRLSRC